MKHCNLLLLDHFKSMISIGFLISQPGMAFINHIEIGVIPWDQLEDFV